MKERDCAGCTNQALWGCDALEVVKEDGTTEWVGRAQMPMRIDGEEVFRCPRRPIKDDPDYWSRLLFYYGMFKKGHLPDPGAVSEQSNRAMSLFQIVEDIASECDRDLRDQESSKRGRQQAQGKRGR